MSVEEILLMLEAARWAPTHKLTEPWRFQVFCGLAKTELAERQTQALFNKLGRSAETELKANKFKFNASQSGAVVAIVMQRDANERLPLNEELWAVSCAVQNVHLHARSLQLGCFWSTGAAVNFPEIRLLLQLNPLDVHMGWLYVGRFSSQKKLIKSRMAVEQYTKIINEL